ncbi:hypothetical protein OIU77_001854 [Salix suchowensis]|uniref:Protein kinase domain-containing protein n=1 Tax=Salix suchowensis TaxID=1278906 RepID=A0ABQ9B508_9ROSI|nr:hypothetical protein OIU77_001854 [Salix suchowensis]
MDTSSRISKIRSNERERLHGPPWSKALQRALLSCTYTMLDYAQTGLIAAVFFFKVLLTPTHLVIVMEYAAAGELFDGICNAGRFSEDEVRIV